MTWQLTKQRTCTLQSSFAFISIYQAEGPLKDVFAGLYVALDRVVKAEMEVLSFGMLAMFLFPSPVKFNHLFRQLSLVCLPLLVAPRGYCVTLWCGLLHQQEESVQEVVLLHCSSDRIPSPSCWLFLLCLNMQQSSACSCLKLWFICCHHTQFCCFIVCFEKNSDDLNSWSLMDLWKTLA